MKLKDWCMGDVLQEAINKYGKEHQTMVAIGELAELSDVLAKSLRVDRHEDFKKDVLTEVADVYICLEQVCMMWGFSLDELYKEMEYKVKRLEKRLNEKSSTM